MQVRKGTIHSLDTTQALVQVKFSDDFISDFLPWLTSAGSLLRIWNPPQLSEQVVVVANEEDMSDGIIIGSLYQQAFKPLSSNVNQVQLDCTGELTLNTALLNLIAQDGDSVIKGISHIGHTHGQNSGNHYGGGAITNPPGSALAGDGPKK